MHTLRVVNSAKHHQILVSGVLRLRRFVREHGIRTVINLRGRPFSDWYPLQAQTTQALGISQEDVTTSANRLPPPGEIRRLIEIFDQTEYPILIHCQQGADRTGLATTAYLLLYTDADLATALRQNSPRYGHVAIHTAASMDEFFDLYANWLKENGTTHTPAHFRRWERRNTQRARAVLGWNCFGRQAQSTSGSR